MAKKKKRIQPLRTPSFGGSQEACITGFMRITNDLTHTKPFPVLNKYFAFDLLKFYLKELESYTMKFNDIMQMSDMLSKIWKSDRYKNTAAANVMRQFPEYKKFIMDVRKYLKSPFSSENENAINDSWLATLNNYFIANMRPEDKASRGFYLLELAIHVSFMKMSIYKNWYDTNRTVYSFRESTVKDAGKLILDNSNFKPSEFLDLADQGPLMLYIVDEKKQIQTVGLISFIADHMAIFTYSEKHGCGALVLSEDELKSELSPVEFLKIINPHKSLPVLKFILGISHLIDNEDETYGDTYPIRELIEDENFSLDDLFNDNSVIHDVLQVLSLGYYMTYKHKIEPEEEEVTLAPSKETKSVTDSNGKKKPNKIKHYDIMESTVYISKPKITKASDAHGTPKAPHYRRGHSHSFWVGTGEDKKKVKYYVEGVCVNGYVPTEKDFAVRKRIKNIK